MIRSRDKAVPKSGRFFVGFVGLALRLRKGRPKSFDELRKLGQAIAAETVTTSRGTRITLAEAILRSWAESKEPILQKAFMEYSFGKVPDKLETNPLEERKTLILYYGHERELKRLENGSNTTS